MIVLKKRLITRKRTFCAERAITNALTLDINYRVGYWSYSKAAHAGERSRRVYYYNPTGYRWVFHSDFPGKGRRMVWGRFRRRLYCFRTGGNALALLIPAVRGKTRHLDNYDV